MRYSGGAWALAVLSFTSNVFAQSTTDADTDTATATTTDADSPTNTAEPNDQYCPNIPAWNPCKGREDLDCATFLVPEDWSDNSRGQRPLNLIRIPAKDADGNTLTDAFSIITNPGGPGSSGIKDILDEGKGDDGYWAPSDHLLTF